MFDLCTSGIIVRTLEEGEQHIGGSIMKEDDVLAVIDGGITTKK
jgi:hypothetical protein